MLRDLVYKVYSKDELGSVVEVIDEEDFIQPVANNVIVECNQISGIRTLLLIDVDRYDVVTVLSMTTIENVEG